MCTQMTVEINNKYSFNPVRTQAHIKSLEGSHQINKGDSEEWNI